MNQLYSIIQEYENENSDEKTTLESILAIIKSGELFDKETVETILKVSKNDDRGDDVLIECFRRTNELYYNSKWDHIMIVM